MNQHLAIRGLRKLRPRIEAQSVSLIGGQRVVTSNSLESQVATRGPSISEKGGKPLSSVVGLEVLSDSFSVIALGRQACAC